MRIIPTIIIIGALFSAWVSLAHAEPDFNKLADAIYIAEGGSKTSHPYGILARYKHTTPRQACLNTLKHKYRDWASNGKRGPFLEYLASKYAPIGASNDPTGLNRNWLKNVKHHYLKKAK